MEVSLKEEDKSLLQSAIREFQDWKAAKAAEEAANPHHLEAELSLSPAAPQPRLEPKKESGIDHYDNCPNCHKTINEKARKELEPQIIKEALAKEVDRVKNLKKPVICEGCGSIVESTEPKCPSCSGTKTRKFSY